MFFTKKSRSFFDDESIKSHKLVHSKNFIKNLAIFFKKDRSNRMHITSAKGIRFCLRFYKKLDTGNKIEQIKGLNYTIYEFPKKQKILIINSFFRFINKPLKFKKVFFKNYLLKRIYPTKIYIEESADEIKTYLDQKLVQLILDQSPLIACSWLGTKIYPDNNKNFWFDYINSCINFMTNPDSFDKMIWSTKNLMKKKKYRDIEFKLSAFENKKSSLFTSHDQIKENYFSLNFSKESYYSLKIQNYLKSIKWRNKIFKKENLLFTDRFVRKTKMSHSPLILLS